MTVSSSYHVELVVLDDVCPVILRLDFELRTHKLLLILEHQDANFSFDVIHRHLTGEAVVEAPPPSKKTGPKFRSSEFQLSKVDYSSMIYYAERNASSEFSNCEHLSCDDFISSRGFFCYVLSVGE